MNRLYRHLLLALAATSIWAQEDPRQIIVKSSAREAHDLELVRNYTFQIHRQERSLDSAGKVTKTEATDYDVLFLSGQPYQRLIGRDGKPLPAKEESKEKEKLDKEAAKRAKESEKDRQKRRAEEMKDLEEERKFRLEVADAYNFTLLREEAISGHPAWVIQAVPKPGFKPRSSDGKVLSKIRGTLWVSKADYRWVRIEAEVIDTVSLGLFLLRLNPGTRLTFEATKVGDEVWLPRHAFIHGDARLALLKKIRGDFEVHWDNYRKFSVDSRVLDAVVEPSPK